MDKKHFEENGEFPDFIAAAKEHGVTEIVLELSGETRPRRIAGTTAVTAVPVTRIRLVGFINADGGGDPFATEEFDWVKVIEPRTELDERNTIESIVRAARARGLSVASAIAYA